MANAFARDFSSIVKIWLDSKEIQIVDEKMADDFAENEFEELARFLIVQPYVLMQLI